MSELPPPRTDPALRLDEHLAKLPEGASCRGLFFQGTMRYVHKVAPSADLVKAAGLRETRYVTFSHFPYGDFLKMSAAGALVINPTHAAEGLRELGAHAYDTLLESHVGKVVLGAFGRNFDYVVMAGARAYSVSLNFGKVEVEAVSTGHVRYHFRDMPAFLDTFQRGVFEGGMRACGVTGEVVPESHDVANATLDIQWR